MKRIFSIIICLITILPIMSQTEDDARIGECLNTSDWFELRRVYEQAEKKTLMPMLKSFAESMIATQFNQPEKASTYIRELINKHGNEIGMGNIIGMGFILASNEAKLGKYADAAQTLANIIKTFEQYTDSTSLLMHRQYEKQYRILSQYEGINRTASPKEDYHLPFRIDSIGHKSKQVATIIIPAEVNRKCQDIVFDTGAGVNIVSTKAVNKLGLNLHEIETGVTGIGKQKGKFAVAQTLQMGNLTLNNVPFYVVDISSGIDSIDVYMNHLDMIIGVNFIHAMQEIQINFEKNEIVIPQTLSTLQDNETSNMTGGIADLFVIEGRGNEERMLFCLDTGAGSSNLGSKYYQRHKEFLTTQCKADTLRSAGAGGVLIEQAYRMPDFCLEINGTSHIFPEIMVATKGSITDTREGNFGMDYFLQFKKVIFNTKDMFVRFIK